MTAIPTITRYPAAALDPRQSRALAALIDQIWPQPDVRLPELAARLRESSPIGSQRLIAWQGNQAVAHAHTFSRPIQTPTGRLEAMALAGVCVQPQLRSLGLGKAIVKQAFEQVEQGDFAFSLFQTGVPGFYEKLGCRAVANQFIDSTSQLTGSPWHHVHVMIYPAAFPWPAGQIDLLGPGY